MPAVTPRRSTARARLAGVAARVAVAAIVVVAGCRGQSGGNAERFCGEVAENRDGLTNPELIFADDIEPLLDLYRDIAEVAPLAVEDDWNQLVSAYETASTVVPGDQASEQEALAAIYSSEESAAAVDQWLRSNCAVDIGPVFTIVPHTPATAPPETVVATTVP